VASRTTRHHTPRVEVQLLKYRIPAPIPDPRITNLAKLGFNHVCFAVDDVVAEVAKLEAAGIKRRSPARAKINLRPPPPRWSSWRYQPEPRLKRTRRTRPAARHLSHGRGKFSFGEVPRPCATILVIGGLRGESAGPARSTWPLGPALGAWRRRCVAELPWTRDFVHERTHDGHALRLLTVVDEYTRECLAIRVARRLRSEDVLQQLT
jgi:transposase InsO family protein